MRWSSRTFSDGEAARPRVTAMSMISGMHRLCRQLYGRPFPIRPLMSSDGTPRYRTEDGVEIFADHLETQLTPNPTTEVQHVETIERQVKNYFESPKAPTEDPVVFSPGKENLFHPLALTTRVRNSPLNLSESSICSIDECQTFLPKTKSLKIFQQNVRSIKRNIDGLLPILIKSNVDWDYIDVSSFTFLDMLAFHGILPAHTFPTHSKTCLDHVLLKTKKNSHCLLQGAKNNNKKLWKTIKEITYSNKPHQCYLELISTPNPQYKINNINQFFTCVGKTLAEKITKNINTQTTPIALKSHPHSFVLFPTNVHEVSTIINNLKLNSAAGLDGIPPEILKTNVSYLSQ
ncbi:unnamed protein product [Leptidea sinapis]|uniref:Uncharacterized protein n=1 Tax=Leptidea sinapis TaxID=189913 RepID=A0A5E4QPD2_9NEOP|nr:unnamed protein product [Leptidea sinapis]